MQKLNRNWFAEGLLDIEYKQYLLLGYLQGVKSRFAQTLLYPDFQELIQHVRDLAAFQENLEAIRSQFPKTITGIDPVKLSWKKEDAISDGSLNEIEQVIEFAKPRLTAYAEEGRGLYELIDENIQIESVGLVPLSQQEGYLLLRRGTQQEVSAYQYHTTVFEEANERFRGLHLQFMCSFSYGLVSTYEAIKLELIRHNRNLPNPATFSVQSRLEFPEQESLVPVTKRKFMRHLAQMGWG